MTQRQALPEAALQQLFTEARTVNGFLPVPVSDETLHTLYDLLKWGPTAYNAKPLFDSNAALTEQTAFRNSSLQGAYLILAARALGLDAGPQSGFNPGLVNLGVADPKGIRPRNARLAFEDVAQIL